MTAKTNKKSGLLSQRENVFPGGVNSVNSTIRAKSSAPTKKYGGKSYLKETLKKQHLEKELIRLNIEKRNKEFERECIARMTEANLLCNKFNVPKAFSVLNDEVKFYLNFI